MSVHIYKKSYFFWGILLIFLLSSCTRSPKVMLPGEMSDGSILLPNHYKLTPVGEQIPVGDLPLNMVISPDGKFLAVTNNGYSEQFVSIIDVATHKQIQTLPVRASFFGIDFTNDGNSLFVSGGGINQVYRFVKQNGKFVLADSIRISKDPEANIFVMGIKSADNGKTLYVATKALKEILKISVPDKRIVKKLRLGSFLYDVLLTPDNKKLYVSEWGGKSVVIIDPRNFTVLKTIPVGDHPNKMALSKDGRLFVANANTDNISVINTNTDSIVETISILPYKGARYGSTPNGLAISLDGKMLFVANADNNDVAVVDISHPGASKILGLIPAGWYPTAVALSKDGKELFIANGKGVKSKANPKGPIPTEKGYETKQYIGGLLWGTISVLPVPDKKKLATFTRQVWKNNGWGRVTKKKNRPLIRKIHAIPRKVGDPSFIKHAVYIIKENRTYDQVFGDFPQGNGDTSLVLFGRKITPNHHKLAETFVLFDNFYVNSEVSADGHEWCDAAIATDFVEKTWPTVYSERGGKYPGEGNFEIAFPTIGYIWDMAAKKGISYRDYGEFIYATGDTTKPNKTIMTNLKGHFDRGYRPWDLDYPDVLRAREFIRELHEYEKTGSWPNLIIMLLPDDHNYGTTPGKRTPRAMTANNDLALGMIVDAISRSQFWKETAIFVVEDDAQNGPDHVDCHRSVALIASPYAKRGYVDHNMYDTASLLKTIELILGLPPMSQYDAAAFPMFSAFRDKPNTAPYDNLPNEWPLEEYNTKTAYGAAASLAMNFKEPDLVPMQELNEIVWKSIKGVNSEMPGIKNERYRQLF